jgi:hypothetical protein
LICVGNDCSKNARYGTFAHEMAHSVMFLLYENDCLPYCKQSLMRKEIFEQVKFLIVLKLNL